MAKMAIPGTYTLPKPRFQSYSQVQVDQFFSYWVSLGTRIMKFRHQPLPEDRLSAVVVKVYRDYPRRKMIDLRNKTRDIATFEGRCPWTVDDWREGFLDRFGSGNYTCYLNEMGVSGAICRADVRVHDDNRPAKVAIDDLDVSHPDNRSYIQQLRDSGIKVPGDEGYVSQSEQERLEMEEKNTNALQSRMLDMAETVGELKAQVRQPAAAPVPDAGLTKTAAEAAIGIMADVTKNALATADQRVADAGKSQNVSGIFEMVTTLAEKFKPDNSLLVEALRREAELSSKILELQSNRMAEESRAHREELSAMRQQLAQLQAQRNEREPETRNTLDQLSEAVELVDKLRGLSGGGAERAPRESFWERNMGTVLGVVNTGIAAFSAAAHNMAVARTGQGQPVAPPAAPPVAVQVRPGGAPGPAPGQPDPDEMLAIQRGVPPVTIPMLRRVTEPLLAHFIGAPETDGYSFAEWVVTGGTNARETQDGRAEYMLMRAAEENEPGSLKRLVMAWPPIGNRIGGFAAGKFDVFIQEFMDYDRWLASQPAAPAA